MRALHRLYIFHPFGYRNSMNEQSALKPRFWYLSEAVVLAALDEPNSKSNITAEVDCLVLKYMEALRSRSLLSSSLPPRWPIEAVALRLATALCHSPGEAKSGS